MSDRPDIEVAVAFGAAPLAALSTLTWTDISADVDLDAAPITIRRGRATELDRIEAGTLTLQLRNTDRRYDPSYAGSPYWPFVRPRARIRVRARWPKATGVWRALFTGYVEAWQPVYGGGRQAWARVRASDGLAVLARTIFTQAAALPPGETTRNAVSTILNAIGWPAADRVLSGDSGTRVTPTAYTDAAALQALQQIAATDDGSFYMSADGEAVWRDRFYRIRASTVLATYGDDAAGPERWILGTSRIGPDAVLRPAGYVAGQTSETPYLDAPLTYDDDWLYNDVRVTREGGTEQVATDATSIATYGRSRRAESGLLLQTDGEALDRAQWRLRRYAEPVVRFKEVVTTGQLRPPTSLAWLALISREIDNLVEVRKRPPGGGIIAQRCRVEAIAHTISRPAWTVTLTLGAAVNEQYLVLDDPVRGVLDAAALAY